MNKTISRKQAAAEERRLNRCLNDVVDDAARGIIRVAIKRSWGNPQKMSALLGEFIRDEATAFGDRLHSRITELLEGMAKTEESEECPI